MKLYPVQSLTVQATSFCNLDCRYCYLPNRSEKGTFDLSLIPVLFRNLIASELLCDDSLHWSWHAGEPLVAGYPFYRDATRSIFRHKPRRLDLSIGLQTNATLVNESLADLFRDYSYSVGVSIDGPAFLHDASRVFRNGKGSFESTMKGISLLQRKEVPFHVICVLTRKSLRHPEDLYHFFRNLGVTGVAFNIEEIEGIHTASSMSAEGTGTEFDRFFSTFFSLHLSHGEPFAIREWSRFRTVWEEELVNGTTVPFDHLTIDQQGNFFHLFPELATQKVHPRYGSFIFGNIRTGLIRDAVHQSGFQKILSDIRKGVRTCRKTCDYYSICGGGMASNKLHEHGTFATTSTMYCTLMVRQLSEVVHRLSGPLAPSV